jgi:hypothetical protein
MSGMLNKGDPMNKFFITQAENGYIVDYYDFETETMKQIVFEETEGDKLKSTQELLQEIIIYFDKSGSRYDKERLRVTREPGDKYEG